MITAWREMSYRRLDTDHSLKQRLEFEYRSENSFIDKDEILDQMKDWGMEQEEEWD